jgi:hypothetical protein
LARQRYHLEVEVDSSFLLVLKYFHFYFGIPMGEVSVVALNLEVFVSLFLAGQIHSSHYYLGIYLYLFQLLFHLLVPSMLLEPMGDY